MKHDDTPMWDDPNESAFVRELLQSGRRTQVEYDVERGLSEHLARISAGVGTPTWAGSAAAAGAAAKSVTPSWLGYVILPLAAAGIASLTWMLSTTQPATPTVESLPTEPTIEVSPAPAALPSPASPADDRTAPPSMSASASDRALRSADATMREPRPGQPSRVASLDSEPRAQRATDRAGDNTMRGARESESQVRTAQPAPTSSQRSNSTASDSRSSDTHAASVRNNPASASRVAAATEARVQPPTAAERANAVKQPASAAKPAALPVVDEAQLEREMQMLAVTQRVLASNPSRALRLAEQGEREFPRTMFSAERRQLALLAMVKLGRLEEARRIGQPFLAQYPKAPWSERLRRALASGQVD